MSGSGMDLDAESRRVLEFDGLLERIAARAATALGADRIRALAPSSAAQALRSELAILREVWRHLDEHSRLLPGGIPDPRAAVSLLAVEGAGLAPKPLRELAAATMAASELRAALLRLTEDDYPRLHELGRALPDLRDEARAVLSCIDADGAIADEASAELGRIRRSRARVGEQLQRMLLGILRDPGHEPLIRDEFITQRNGRYVVPVRTDSPRALKGIVHASSSSGATQFVEPLESVELNNEMVRWSEREQEEQERVLLQWSDRFRRRRDDVPTALAALGTVDALQARALFGREIGAVLPVVEESAALELTEVRHPLLDLQLRAQGARCVPLTLRLEPADQVLVLSGPNTGGKTVALKTLGLAVLAAQSGIPVPALSASLPVYRQLRADIGDHQSIEANLSTFSAHIRAVATFLEQAASPGLFLFDEIGGGTEPTEGAALAQAILEALRVPGMTVVATTHQQPLKAWALTTEGAATAAMEFDVATLRPTFRLLMGAAGESAGIEIAARLGLDPRIVERARNHLRPESRLAERYATKLRELIAETEQERERVDESRRELQADRRRLEQQVERAEQRRRADVDAALERLAREFRDRARKELGAIRDQAERAAAERRVARLEARLGSGLAKARAELIPGEPGVAPPGRVPERVDPGMSVFVTALGREGTVESVRGNKVEVRVGGITVNTELHELRLTTGSGRRAAAAPAAGSAVGTPSLGETPRELRLIGLTVDEARERLDRFLDAATLAGHEEVRVIHGYGTGRLRKAMREFLASHPLVARQRPGEGHEGGDGATVVTLR